MSVITEVSLIRLNFILYLWIFNVDFYIELYYFRSFNDVNLEIILKRLSMAQRQHFIIGLIILGSIVFFIFAMAILISSLGNGGSYKMTATGSRVGLIEVTGIIYDAENVVRQFERYANDKSVKSIVLRIESPGGGTAASQEIYEKVRRVRDSGKPVVASMGAVAASGGYYIACGADTIMANNSTTTGSIGVIAEIPNAKKLMDKIGIHYEVIKSGQFKDIGSPYRPMTKDDRKQLQNWIDDAYNQFVDIITRERQLDRGTVLKYADGRIFTGKQALDFGLIDTLGTYEDAIKLAAKLGGIDSDDPKTVKERRRKATIFDILFGDVSKVFDLLNRWPRIKYQLVL